LFIRFVQIVLLTEKFSFLSQYTDLRAASTLPPPPRQLFIRALSKDPAFLETYFDFLVARVKRGNGYTAMIKTWSGLTVEAILQMRQARIPDETIVSRIMPFIAQGLQLKESTEFQIACYMVLTVLASKRTLADNVIDAAMDAICQGWTEESRRGALMCLVTLARCRQGNAAFTGLAVKSLFSLKYFLSLTGVNC
jgi:U3 small nucleolar RNA-associated protein 10